MKLGKFDINLLDTCIFGLDGGAMFGIIPKNLWSKAYHPGDEQNRIPLSARPLLIRWDDRIALVDTGNGTKLSDKLCSIYGIDKSKCDLEPVLVQYNVKPEDVTDIILTHLHFDHAGGNTFLRGSDIVPAYPNAKYYVQKEHYKWALKPSEKDRASFFPENYVPLFENGMLELLEGEGELFPGIEVINAFGHTESMQLVKISDGGDTLLYMADLAPTAAHIPMPFVMGYDNYPMKTLEDKKHIYPRAYEEQWLLGFEHDYKTRAVRLISNEKGFFPGENVDL